MESSILFFAVIATLFLAFRGWSTALSWIARRQAERRQTLDEMMVFAQATTARPLAQLQAMLAWHAQDGWSPSQKDEGMR